jgi:Animal haem peroxidase/Secretion system C-terminal sorting domain/HYR domain/Lectin C-type domain
MIKIYLSRLKHLAMLTPFVLLTAQSLDAQTRPKYRTLDGTLNNLSYPDFGKTGIPFYRELPAEYGDGKSTMVTNRPNPRLLSNKLSDEPEDDHNDRYMAGMFYSWGQFLDHDITRRGGGTEASPIPLPSGESKFTAPIAFTRSAAHPGSGFSTPRDQTNTTTSWVDASQVYGDNPTRANWLRTFQGGKLKVSAGNLLPFNTITGEYSSTIDPSAPTMDDTRSRTTGEIQKVFVAGDPRASEHPILTSLHTLMVREHNRICGTLSTSGLSDEVIYQKARKEVGALIQVVSYGQWISSLGVTLQSYTGYKSAARPDIMNTFATAAYRWHTMVENDIIFRNNSCNGVGPVELPLKDIFFNPSIVRTNGIDPILKGITVHRSYETDLRVNDGLRNNLFGPGQNSDLVAINIQRGRDHGLPNYNTVRQHYTGSPAFTFTDIAGSSRTSVSSSSPGSGELVAPLMQSLYGSVNTVDLWVGLYAEPRLSGKSVGKTVDAILRGQLERLRDGDFYYFENDPELTAADKSRIRSTTLKHIIQRNTTAGDLQDNVFFVKSCSSDPSEFDDIAKRSCTETPQYEGWTFLGKQGVKSYFKWNGGTANFANAKSLAERLGGNLLRVANATENNYVKSLIPAGASVYLDLSRIGTQWKYSYSFNANDILLSGIVSPYYNWKAGEPNNASGSEHRAQMYSDGQWNDLPETALQTVIAEVETNDFSAPTFSYCPPSVNVSLGLLSLCKSASWQNPVASDNCSTVTMTQTSGFKSGSCFGLGSHTITYTAADSKGNKATCSFNVVGYKTFSLFLEGNESLAMEAQAEVNRTAIQFVNNTGYKNDYFIVEKINPSTGQFEKVEIVNNLTKDKSVNDYISYDNSPNEGENTYRVKLIYHDGTEKVSASKTVNFKGLTEVRVYPNPVSDIVNIDLSNYKNQPVEIYLYNYLGQQLLVEKVENASNSAFEMNVAPFQAGNYMVRVKSKGKRDVMKSLIIAH